MENIRIFDELCKALKLPDKAADELREEWDASQVTYRKNHIPWLVESFVDQQCRWLGMKDETRQLLIDGLCAFKEVPALERLVWHAYFRIMIEEKTVSVNWPIIGVDIHEKAPLIYAYVMLGAIPLTRERHLRRHIPEAVTIRTLLAMETYIHRYRQWYGVWGFDQQEWMANHLQERIVRVGRLEFAFGSWGHDFVVYRNKETKQVVIFASNGCEIGEGGYFAEQVEGGGRATIMKAYIEVTDDHIEGYPVVPTGRILMEKIRIKRDEYVRILGEGDPVLFIHIPAGGSMDFAECGDSLNKAHGFFASHYPERSWKAFVSSSWLFDSQFETQLTPDSNIRRFMMEFYLFPAKHNQYKGMQMFVYGKEYDDISMAPQDNSLRRAIASHVRNGGKWRGSSAVLFPEDMDWGKQIYRTGRALVSV